MKKKIFLGIFALAVVFQANAQDKTINFGFKVAPAIAWLDIDDHNVKSDGSVPKCNWGFFGIWNFTKNFSLVSGFNINSLGGNYKTLTEKNKIRLSEFEIPAAFQMRTDNIKNFKFYVQIGLAGAYIFKAKDKDDKDLFDNNDARHINTSYFVTAGTEYAVTGGVSLIGQLKYNGGFTSVMDTDKMKANFVELGLGVMF